jgi:hypothetical protein
MKTSLGSKFFIISEASTRCTVYSLLLRLREYETEASFQNMGPVSVPVRTPMPSRGVLSLFRKRENREFKQKGTA